jgi:hypothetical protein
LKLYKELKNCLEIEAPDLYSREVLCEQINKANLVIQLLLFEIFIVPDEILGSYLVKHLIKMEKEGFTKKFICICGETFDKERR